MNAKLALAIGLVVITSGCSSMGAMRGNSDGGGDAGERSYMGGSAPTNVDAAGSATLGTGSVSTSDQDQRVNAASGIGIDD
jgi:hypothetical protein